MLRRTEVCSWFPALPCTAPPHGCAQVHSGCASKSSSHLIQAQGQANSEIDGRHDQGSNPIFLTSHSPSSRTNLGVWRDDTAGKSVSCSYSRTELSSSHRHQAAHNQLELQLQDILCPLLASEGLCTHTYPPHPIKLKVNNYKKKSWQAM